MKVLFVGLAGTFAIAWAACGDRNPHTPAPAGTFGYFERFVAKKDAGGDEEGMMEFDTWQFRIGVELPWAATILGDDAWLVTRHLPPLAGTREEARDEPSRHRYRIYRQDKGVESAESAPLLAHEWVVGEGASGEISAAGNGVDALVAWLETVDGERMVALRVIGNARLLDDAWYVRLPPHVEPSMQVFVAARPGAAGWVACVPTFEGRGDDRGLRCAEVGPEPGEVGTWHRLATEEPGRPRWLGSVAGSLYLIVRNLHNVSDEWIAALPLHPDGSAGGAPLEIADFAQRPAAFVHTIPISNGVLFHDSTNGRTLMWDGLEVKRARGNPGGLVSFEHRGIVYTVRGGHEGYTGFVVWDEEAGEAEIRPWPAVVHEFLGAGIGHHILPASDNGVVLTGAPVDIHHVLIVRPRP